MSDLNKRHILVDEDILILREMKGILSNGISNLKSRGVRSVNIEIELIEHIRNELNKSE